MKKIETTAIKTDFHIGNSFPHYTKKGRFVQPSY